MSARVSNILVGLALLGLSAPDAVADEPPADTVLARVKIKTGKGELKHPGYLIELEVENTLILKDGAKHEVTLLVTKKGKSFKVKVGYKKNGHAVLSGATTVTKKKWGNVKKGATTVAVLIDPDSKRPDDIDKPKDDDPLGGL